MKRNGKTRDAGAQLTDAQRFALIRRVMIKAFDAFESWEAQRVAVALAYLVHAITTGTIVDWSDDTDDQGDAVIRFLRAQFPPADPVWQFVLCGEKGR